jgi:hypothetical protein
MMYFAVVSSAEDRSAVDAGIENIQNEVPGCDVCLRPLGSFDGQAQPASREPVAHVDGSTTTDEWRVALRVIEGDLTHNWKQEVARELSEPIDAGKRPACARRRRLLRCLR